MDILVGSTGFVGTNLMKSHSFTGCYHSTDVSDAYGTYPDLLVYAGVPAEMYLANKDPEKDMDVIRAAMYNMEMIRPKQVVLVSTIAVYKNPIDVDENTPIVTEGLSAYGKNRYELERYVMDHYDNHLIVRLPALFGEGLKKNFIYDFIHRIPSMLTETKYHELHSADQAIENYYRLLDNGFYKCRELSRDDEQRLRKYFDEAGFSALNFTDSRSVYQFYNLAHLWEHIEIALKNGINILNTATEPMQVGEIYLELTGNEFQNHLGKQPLHYDYKCSHGVFSGMFEHYLFDRKQVLEEIKIFVEEQLL